MTNITQTLYVMEKPCRHNSCMSSQKRTRKLSEDLAIL